MQILLNDNKEEETLERYLSSLIKRIVLKAFYYYVAPFILCHDDDEHRFELLFHITGKSFIEAKRHALSYHVHIIYDAQKRDSM